MSNWQSNELSPYRAAGTSFDMLNGIPAHLHDSVLGEQEFPGRFTFYIEAWTMGTGPDSDEFYPHWCGERPIISTRLVWNP